jgi:exosortase
VNDLRQFWTNLPHKTAFAVVFGAWIALFHWAGNSSFGYVNTPSLFGWLYPVYQSNPDDGLGLLVPLISAALLWTRRQELVAIEKGPWSPALLLVVAGIAIHLLGFLVQQTRLSLLGFLLGFYGITGMLWGRDWMRNTVFPFSLLLFCVPITAYLDGPTSVLRLLVAKIATGFCTEVLQLKLVREGTAVYNVLPNGLRGFQFEVAPACSGIRSLTVVLLLAFVHGWLTLKSGWRRALVVLAAPLLAVFGNVFRLIVVFIFGEAFGEAAGSAIENKFGFVTFLFALAGVVLLGRWLSEARPNAQPKTE